MRTPNYEAWSDGEHARVFDYLAPYPIPLLRKHYEGFNEIRLFSIAEHRIRGNKFFEIGCATGELLRYLSHEHPRFDYQGFDISAPALRTASNKFGEAQFHLIKDIRDIKSRFGRASVVFARDVVIHQERPFEFIDALLSLAEECLVMRLRTRDVGETVLDVDTSCQRHYGKYWVPYMVLNTAELVSRLSSSLAVHHITVSRRYEVLGGFNGRYLPRDLYYQETGGAETAVLVALGTERKDTEVTVHYHDRPDGPVFTLTERLVLRICRMLRNSRAVPAPPGTAR